jgi:hypothetical protein
LIIKLIKHIPVVFIIMIIILIFLLPLVCNQLYAQRSKTIAASNQSITNSVNNYQAIANRLWFGPKGVGEFIKVLAALQTQMALNVSSLYTNSTSDSQDVFASLFAPQTETCMMNVTRNVNDLYNNETALELYLCCVLSPFNAPGIGAFMGNVESYFMGPSQNTWAGFQNDIIISVNNIQMLRSVVANSIQAKMCKDDIRIHVPQTQSARAELAGQIMGVVVKTYTYVISRALALQGCFLNQTSVTGCAFNTSLTTAEVAAPNYSFLAYDQFYQSTCGYQSLLAFDIFQRVNVAC